VLSMMRPMGRLSFLLSISGVNIAVLIAVLLSLTFRPSGGGHLAVLIVVGSLQWLWMTLHIRRFADAGRGPGWSIAMFLLCFGVFTVGYGMMAALWSSPEIQQEAFRTGGGIAANGAVSHVETSAMLVEAGRIIASMVGLGGALVLSGMIVFALGAVAFISGCFSMIALLLPARLQQITNIMVSEPTLVPRIK
jgi:hypothetical protein